MLPGRGGIYIMSAIDVINFCCNNVLSKSECELYIVAKTKANMETFLGYGIMIYYEIMTVQA